MVVADFLGQQDQQVVVEVVADQVQQSFIFSRRSYCLPLYIFHVVQAVPEVQQGSQAQMEDSLKYRFFSHTHQQTQSREEETPESVETREPVLQTVEAVPEVQLLEQVKNEWSGWVCFQSSQAPVEQTEDLKRAERVRVSVFPQPDL